MGTAAIALPLLVLLLFKAPPLATVALVAVACAIGVWELFGMLAAGGIAPLRAVGAVSAAVLFLSIAMPALAVAPAIPAIMLAIAAAALLPREGDVHLRARRRRRRCSPPATWAPSAERSPPCA